MPPVSPTGPVPPSTNSPSSTTITPSDTSITAPVIATPLARSTSKLLYKPILISVGASIVLGIIAQAIPTDSNATFSPSTWLAGLLSLIVTVVAVYSLVLQWRFFAANRPVLLKVGIVFLATISLAIPTALLLGDQAGAQAFHNAARFDVTAFLTALLIVGSSATVLLATGNAIYIATGFRKAVKILGYIAMVLVWLLVAAISYLAYMTEYSSHDPNSE